MKKRELIDKLVDGKILAIKAKKTGNVLFTRTDPETPYFVDGFDPERTFSVNAIYRWLRDKRDTLRVRNGIAVIS